MLCLEEIQVAFFTKTMTVTSSHSDNNNPHDSIFRGYMSDKLAAKDSYLYYLPRKLYSLITPLTIDIDSTSFVDNDLSNSYSDILYRARLKTDDGFLLLHLEHQSSHDPLMPLRIMEYRARILRRYKDNYPKEKLPIIYTVVIYNGTSSYTSSTDFAEMFTHPNLARKYMIPNFGLLDVHKIADEEFRERGLSGIAEYMLKHGARKDFYKEAENKSPMLLHSFSTLTQLPSKSLLMKATSYLLNQEKDSSLIIERLTEFLPQETTDTIMTLAQALETKGRQEGLQTGLQTGRQEGQIFLLERFLKKRFGEEAISYFPTIEKTPESSFDDLLEKIAKAETIEDLLKD